MTDVADPWGKVIDRDMDANRFASVVILATGCFTKIVSPICIRKQYPSEALGGAILVKMVNIQRLAIPRTESAIHAAF